MTILDSIYRRRELREAHYDEVETVHVINLNPVILVGGIPARENYCWWKFWCCVPANNMRKQT